MVFNIPTSVLVIIQLLVLVWLGIMTVLLLRTIANYNRLTQGASSQTLSELLNQVINQHKASQKERQEVIEQIRAVEKRLDGALQKVSLIRFNPFSDTGGDQSFVLALLNDESSGIVITSLYARTGTRWYIKTIKKGKALEYELSKEEQQAIKQAR